MKQVQARTKLEAEAEPKARNAPQPMLSEALYNYLVEICASTVSTVTFITCYGIAFAITCSFYLSTALLLTCVLCGVYIVTFFAACHAVAFDAIGSTTALFLKAFDAMRPANIVWAMQNPTSLVAMVCDLTEGSLRKFAATVNRRLIRRLETMFGIPEEDEASTSETEIIGKP